MHSARPRLLADAPGASLCACVWICVCVCVFVDVTEVEVKALLLGVGCIGSIPKEKHRYNDINSSVASLCFQRWKWCQPRLLPEA